MFHAYQTAWLKVSQCALHSIFMSSMMSVGSSVPCCFLVLSFSVFLSFVYLFSYTLYLHSDLHSSFHVNSAKGKLRLRLMRSIAPWRYNILSQVVSPTSSRTSTTQRLLQRSSRMNPATWIRSLRTRVMPNSTMRPSEKRYLHHCSFRSEKNQRTGDKLITLMKKVCCQLSPFSHTQERGDPCTNLVRAKSESQVAKWKTKNSGFSLNDKKSKFSPKSDVRSRSTNFKPSLTEAVSRN